MDSAIFIKYHIHLSVIGLFMKYWKWIFYGEWMEGEMFKLKNRKL